MEIRLSVECPSFRMPAQIYDGLILETCYTLFTGAFEYLGHAINPGFSFSSHVLQILVGDESKALLITGKAN